MTKWVERATFSYFVTLSICHSVTFATYPATAMIDLKALRENPTKFALAAKAKGVKVDIENCFRSTARSGL